jgi:hypothetical protein
MDLFLSSAIVASPPCGKGTFPANAVSSRVGSADVSRWFAAEACSETRRFIYECCRIGSIHLLGAADTLYLGSAGKTSVNLQ